VSNCNSSWFVHLPWNLLLLFTLLTGTGSELPDLAILPR